MSNIVLCLHSRDSESEAIQALALEAGLSVRLQAAIQRDGQPGRCTPGQPATGTVALDGSDWQEGAPSLPFLLHEPMGAPWPGAVAIFDHHGAHPCASAPPEQAVRASSLGQLAEWICDQWCLLQHGHPGASVRWPAGLGWRDGWHRAVPVTRDRPPAANDIGCMSAGVYPHPVLPVELAEIAACDHCLAAACAGQVPGVDLSPGSPGWERLLARTHATYGAGVPLSDFQAAFERACGSVRNAPAMPGAAVDVADLRGLPVDGPVVAATGERYPAVAQYLPVVGSVVGRPYIVHILRGDGIRALRAGGFDGGNVAHRDFIRGLTPGSVGCLGADAPRPNNFYALPERGMFGGTLIG